MKKDSDWVWEALALGEESLLKDAEVDFFDWNATHEKYGTPLIALIVGKATGQEVYDFATGTPEKLQERLSLMKLALAKGASPHAKPPAQFSICKSWWKTEGDKEVENSRTPLVQFNDKSAYSVIASCLEALTNVEGDWKRELRFLRDSARILATYRTTANVGKGTARVPISEGVVDTWQGVLECEDSAEVSIDCKGLNADDSGVVRAHGLVLRHASLVLKAMLGPQFREGATAQVQVEHGTAAVRLLLVVIYTGEEVDENEYDTDTLLSAVELAHQWDVTHAVSSLELAASRKIHDDHFARLLDVAVRLQLHVLIAACTNFAKSSTKVHRQFRLRTYSPDSSAVLSKVYGELDVASATTRKKRRRASQ